MARLQGKVAVITGAASGIGAATAAAMAREGASVVLADRDGDGAEGVAGRIVADGGRASSIRVDVTSDDDVEAMVRAAVDRYGRLDVLHNNAGASLPADRDIVSTSIDTWRFALDVDLLGVVRGIRAAIPAMLETGGGAIVNTASAGPLNGSNSLVAYAAAKAGVISLTKYVATTHGRRGIRCNSIAPGLVLSPGALEHFPFPELLDAVARHQVTPDFTSPDDVAQLAIFLASDESRAINGHTHVIDGGSTVMGAAVPALMDLEARAAAQPAD